VSPHLSREPVRFPGATVTLLCILGSVGGPEILVPCVSKLWDCDCAEGWVNGTWWPAVLRACAAMHPLGHRPQGEHGRTFSLRVAGSFKQLLAVQCFDTRDGIFRGILSSLHFFFFKGGDTKLLMILCVSPGQKNMAETLQGLGFGTRARQAERDRQGRALPTPG
jgi:hypothetical protein